MRVADLFAGGGGVTEGAKRVPGVEVVFAANHWRAAVDLHAARHPEVEHVCQDLQQFDFRLMPRCDLLWASPACQGHSDAAQPGRARDPSLAVAHDHLRTTAWAVVTATLAAQPRVFVVENVPQFRDWRPPGVVVGSAGSKKLAHKAVERQRARSPEGGAHGRAQDGRQRGAPGARSWGDRAGHGGRGVRVLTIHQPWAWAIAEGFKGVENRSWLTHYRGPLLVHAGKTWRRRAVEAQLDELIARGMIPAKPDLAALEAECGHVIARTEVVGLREVLEGDLDPWVIPGGFAWELGEVQRLKPVPWVGRQGLVKFPDERVAELERMEGGR